VLIIQRQRGEISDYRRHPPAHFGKSRDYALYVTEPVGRLLTMEDIDDLVAFAKDDVGEIKDMLVNRALQNGIFKFETRFWTTFETLTMGFGVRQGKSPIAEFKVPNKPNKTAIYAYHGHPAVAEKAYENKLRKTLSQMAQQEPTLLVVMYVGGHLKFKRGRRRHRRR